MKRVRLQAEDCGEGHQAEPEPLFGAVSGERYGFQVWCLMSDCWKGPVRKTRNAAVEAWNAVMAAR